MSVKLIGGSGVGYGAAGSTTATSGTRQATSGLSSITFNDNTSQIYGYGSTPIVCSAYHSTFPSLTPGVWKQIEYNSTYIDTTNSYNKSLAYYVIPVSGFYSINAKVNIHSNGDPITYASVAIVVNSTVPNSTITGGNRAIIPYDKDKDANIIGSSYYADVNQGYTGLDEWTGNASRFIYCYEGEYVSVHAYYQRTYGNFVAYISDRTFNIHYVNL
jgi:hypothetical protein